MKFLYERHLLYIAGVQCENMLTYNQTGYVPGILKAVYRSKQVQERDFTKFFKDLSLYLHLRKENPDLMLNNKELMVHIDDYISYLENVYDNGGILEIKYLSDNAIRRETFDLGFD